jgi:hypothetical protein
MQNSVVIDAADLERFVVRAKRATYVGGGEKLLPYRLGSHDLQFHDGDLVYHDSYVGESDFIGQEIVYHRSEPVWGMNYFGVILLPEEITSAQAGEVIKESLTALYEEGRFLGGFDYRCGRFRYVDSNAGDVRSFTGKEVIYAEATPVYELHYHGGEIR